VSTALPFALTAALASTARAGMPTVTLTDVASARLQTISFFLLLLALATFGVMGLWNLLRRDFPRLPRLTFWRSLAVVSLWGFLFVLVLTMISGARELMTPGAWERDGAIYRLKNPGAAGAAGAGAGYEYNLPAAAPSNPPSTQPATPRGGVR
jgi:hypothetical protein